MIIRSILGLAFVLFSVAIAGAIVVNHQVNKKIPASKINDPAKNQVIIGQPVAVTSQKPTLVNVKTSPTPRAPVKKAIVRQPSVMIVTEVITTETTYQDAIVDSSESSASATAN